MRISVIIPVLNEEASISALLGTLSDSGADELLVADGGSTDRTIEIASRYARIIRSETGRAIQMNTAARCASGDVLLFLHADVRLGATAIEMVRKVMADPLIVGGNFDVRYDGKDWAAAAFTNINRWRRRCGIFYGDSGSFAAALFLIHSAGSFIGRFSKIMNLHDGYAEPGSWLT